MVEAINSEPMIIPGLIALFFVVAMFLFCVTGFVVQMFLEDWHDE